MVEQGQIPKKCKPGYSYVVDSDTCVAYEKPLKTCEKRYSYENDVCQKKEVVGHSLKVCPTGSSLEGAKCVAFESIEAKLKCPYDFELGSSGCVQKLEKKPVAYYPKGSKQLVEDECIIEEFQYPENICDEGEYSSVKKKCIVSIDTNPIKECPKDYTETTNGKCEMRKPLKPLLVCPKYYKLIKGICLRELSAKPSYECEFGEIKGHSCVTSTIDSPVFECKSHAVFSNDQCNQAIVSKATLICPEEYKIETDELSHPIKKNKVLEARKEEKNVKTEEDVTKGRKDVKTRR